MIQKGYKKLCAFVTTKKISILSFVCFCGLLLPLLYLSFFNRASGDDYKYSVFTHAAWLNSHSIIEVIKAACETVRDVYTGWQGTWFSVFVFSLQPEAFNNKAYVIVTFLLLFMWIGSTFFVWNYFLRKVLYFSVWEYVLMTIMILLPVLQFVPGQKSAFFWYNGGIHYILPFSMCQMLLYCLIRFTKQYQVKYFIPIFLIMILLGGSSYQAALFAFILAVYFTIWKVLNKEKKVLLLLIPILGEIAGLIISAKAPGNAVRAGEELNTSISYVFGTIMKSFLYGFQDIRLYLCTIPFLFVGLLLLLVLAIEAFKNTKEQSWKISIWVVLASWTIYFAMQAPAIYANVEVSRGVLNTNMQVFMLACAITVLFVAQKIANHKISSELTVEKCHNYFVIPAFVLAMFFIVIFRGNIKNSITWDCLEYITSGQAVDYKEQMDIQTKLLEDQNTEDVIVPFINDEQGPLMQMPVTQDASAWSNTVTAQFYGKKSVTAIPRTLWEEKYSNN